MVRGSKSGVTPAQREIIEACVAERARCGMCCGKRPIAAIRRATGLTREKIRAELKNVYPGQPYTAATAQEIIDGLHPPGGIIMNEPLTRRFVDAKISEGLTDHAIQQLLKNHPNLPYHRNKTIKKYRRFMAAMDPQPADAVEIEEANVRPEHEGEGMASEVHDPSDSAGHQSESEESCRILEF